MPVADRVLTIAVTNAEHAAIMDSSMDANEALQRLQNACSDLSWGDAKNPCR